MKIIMSLDDAWEYLNEVMAEGDLADAVADLMNANGNEAEAVEEDGRGVYYILRIVDR